MSSSSFWKNKKVFITGASGFIGKQLCQTLEKSKAIIIKYEGNICDRDHLVGEIDETSPEIIFHLAAQALVGFSYKQPAKTYEVNVMGTVNLLEGVRTIPFIKSVVLISTDKVYENREWYWGYRENDTLDGYDPYSNSKSCMELITRCYRRSFFDNENALALSTVRAGNILGPGDYVNGRLLSDCIKAARNGNAIILKNPDAVRPYLDVSDFVRGLMVLAEKQFVNHSIAGEYNMGPDKKNCVSAKEIAEIFCDAWGNTARWEPYINTEKYHEANYLSIDSSKAEHVLKWKPRIPIDESIKRIVQYEKNKI